MHDDIVAIQTQLSFQEDSLQALNDVVTRHQKEIDTLKNMLHLLQENVDAVAKTQGGTEDNAPPPHY